MRVKLLVHRNAIKDALGENSPGLLEEFVEADSLATTVDEIIMKLSLKYPSLCREPIAVWFEGYQIYGHVQIGSLMKPSQSLLLEVRKGEPSGCCPC